MIPASRVSTFGANADGFDFSQVQLLLHLDGTEGSTTFIDSSSYARTVTAVGTADLTTSSPKFGTACLDATTGSYIRTAKDANLAFGTGDFTIECFFKTNNVSTPDIVGGLWGSSANGVGNCGLLLAGTIGSVSLTFQPIQDSLTGIISNNVTSYNLFNGDWHHIAVCREAGVTRIFVDGFLLPVSGSPSYDLNVITGFYEFATVNSRSTGGTGAVTGRKLLCYLDEIRFIKGHALYTDNYDVPSEPFNDF